MPDPSPVPLSTSAEPISSPSGTFPIIGIGASSGGLAALETFFAAFEGQPPPGMAFVLIQHLSPDHKSLLAEILRRRTKLEIFDIEDGMTVRINCIYILPPAQDLRLERGCLHLSEPGQARGQRLPIDFFFQSLAEDQKEKAIALILSGNGGDGSEGLRAIKAAGGLVLVQSPANAEYKGMPESALATGLVDEQLEAAGMPAKLLEYVKRPQQRTQEPGSSVSNLSSSLSDICILLKRQTGHDFSLYKPNTLLRHIERRMGAQGIDTGAAYLEHLRLQPDEINALFQDLLIGVTRFFRDAEAFQFLATEVMPQLLSHRDATAPLRIWCTGCSTGEEAYSLAILVREQLDAMRCNLPVQIFATDIDRHAIDFARAGIYPDSIATDLSAERLGRFFHLEPGGGFRVDKSIRDCVIFSCQDLIKDPPFSRLDLISCRNLLIYFSAELQKKLMPLFHYALKPEGLLFLGSAEGIGDFTRLFASLNQNAKIFRSLHEGLATSYSLNSVSHSPPPQLARPADSRAAVTRLPWRDMAEQEMLRHSPPVAALIRRHGELLYLHGRSGLFLEPMPGEAGPGNLVKMAREGLRPALSTALHQAASSGQVIRRRDITLGDGGAARVDLLVAPVPSATDDQLFLVQLAESQPNPDSPLPPEASAAVDLAALRRELLAKDDHLLSVRSELENANEELMASNEELQSLNEEMQSTNEELETSKEELQSLNEELSTVNGELQSKIQSLSQSNNDMNNLLAGTGIATVFVDHHLRILRFTPCAAEIINLIASDIGRPVDHLVSNLVGYDRLADDVRAVLASLIPSEVEVRNRRGLSYALRIRPYRTIGNVIEGAVITFVDITAIKQAQACRLGAERDQRLANLARDAADAIVVRDLQGRILAWNPGATRLYGWSETEALTMNEAQRVPPELRSIELERLARLCHTETLDPLQSRRLNKSGAALEVSLVATALYDDSGRIYGVASTERVRPPAASQPESHDAKL